MRTKIRSTILMLLIVASCQLHAFDNKAITKTRKIVPVLLGDITVPIVVEQVSRINNIESYHPSEEDIQSSFNYQLSEIWTKSEPTVRQALETAILQGLSDLSTDNFEVLSVNDISMDLNQPPGLEGLSGDNFTLSLPLNGSWWIDVEARVRITREVLGIDVTETRSVDFRIKNIRISQSIATIFDVPLLPRVELSEPVVDFEIDLDIGGFLGSVVASQLEDIVQDMAEEQLAEQLDRFTNGGLSSITAQPTVLGDDAPLLSDTGQYRDLSLLSANIARDMRQHHMPHGMLMKAIVTDSHVESWLDAFAGRQITSHRVIRHDGLMDPPIFTGLFMAGEAFRLMETRSREALENLAHAIEGMRKTVTINGDGPIARSAVPLDSPLGNEVTNSQGDRRFRTKIFAGEPWVSFQGPGGVSRDQNLGVAFGLSMAWRALKDHYPHLAYQCAQLLEHQVDYLVANDWVIIGDEIIDPGSGDVVPPTPWAPASIQRFAFLAAANAATDDKYAQELAHIRDSASLMWISGMLAQREQSQRYYKLNLAFMSLFMIHQFERDQFIREGAKRAYELYERIIHNHSNPSFDVQRLVLGSRHDSQALTGSVRESLAQFLQRSNRERSINGLDYSSIELVEWTENDIDGVSRTSIVPKYPLPIELRKAAGHFQWERSPFSMGDDSTTNPNQKIPGIAITWPYWLARFHDIL